MTQLLLDLPEFTTLTAPAPDLRKYHGIIFNGSAGKDSQAALEITMRAARAAGVADRVYYVHADLGEMEWSGVPQLAKEHADYYRIPFITARATGLDLLGRIAKRRMFPDAGNRYCTSDMKRGPIRTVHTAVAREMRKRFGVAQAQLLNVMGMRAQESPARRRLVPFSHDGSANCPCVSCRHKVAAAAPYIARKQPVPDHLKVGYGSSNTVRNVDTWLPVHHLVTDQVWELIAEAGTRPHPAYSWGLPRLSCSFCVLASKSALILSAQLRPDLAARIARLETQIGHRFQHKRSMADIIAAAERQNGRIEQIEDWVG
ncbi:phosphoadenosine phosphosulfate reductase family protein [Nocardia asiatica]|uniref:phosphoadenosine phosphosulfate reductase family protein n=1 Tax=Nocardia asiatica TaxID=209252 RepID=UPI00030A17CE|nr:phosphoadenosine phosphosulfate reductase family protein [Nocardia asiatica]